MLSVLDDGVSLAIVPRADERRPTDLLPENRRKALGNAALVEVLQERLLPSFIVATDIRAKTPEKDEIPGS
jgi:hypothetical protein